MQLTHAAFNIGGFLRILGVLGGLLVATGVLAQVPISVQVHADKFIYRPGEQGNVAVTVRTAGPEAAGMLRVELLSGMQDVRALATQAVTAQIGNVAMPVMVPVRFDGTEGGRELRATFTPTGGQPVTGSDVVLVTDNPVRLSHLAFLAAPVMADAWEQPADQMRRTYGGLTENNLRPAYCGIVELFAWAPDDFAALAPARDTWRSGQTYYYMYKPALQAIIDGAHKQGMPVVFYANTWIFGPYGFDLARQHPDWFYWRELWYGSTFDAKKLQQWELPDAMHPKPPYNCNPHSWQPGLMSLAPLITKPEVAAFHTDQVLRSMKMFGWDGIRYDNDGWRVRAESDAFGAGAYPAGADPNQLTAGLVRTFRATCEKVYPRFIFGNNGAGLGTNDAGALAQAEREGLVMEESFNGWMRGGGTFEEMRQAIRRGVGTIRQAGGHCYLLGPLYTGANDSPGDVRLLAAIAMAGGAHLCAGGGGLAPAATDYVRFSARYAELLYDRTLRPLPAQTFSVEAPHPVWWNEYAYARPVGERRMQYLLHVINTPTHTTFNAKPDASPPEAGERVSIPGANVAQYAVTPLVQKRIRITGMLPGVDRAWTLTPDGVSLAPQPLEITRQGQTVTVTLPRLDTWSLLVFEGSTL